MVLIPITRPKSNVGRRYLCCHVAGLANLRMECCYLTNKVVLIFLLGFESPTWQPSGYQAQKHQPLSHCSPWYASCPSLLLCLPLQQVENSSPCIPLHLAFHWSQGIFAYSWVNVIIVCFPSGSICLPAGIKGLFWGGGGHSFELDHSDNVAFHLLLSKCTVGLKFHFP